MTESGSNRRILLVSYHFGQDGATGGFRWAALTRLLRARGWEFDVITGPETIQPTGNGSGEEPPHSLSQGMDGTAASPPTEVVRGAIEARGAIEVFPVRSRSRLAPTLGAIGAAPRRVRSSLRRSFRNRSRSAGTRNRSAAGNRRRSLGNRNSTVERPDDPPHPGSMNGVEAIDPEGLDIWTVEAKRPLHSRVLREIASLRATLDWSSWVAEATKLAHTLVRRRDYGCVIVSSPPHETQMVGVRLAAETDIPYLADLQDPWVLGMGAVSRYLPLTARSLGRRRERKMITAASALIFNTELHRKVVSEAVQGFGMDPADTPFLWVVPNGHDDTAPVNRPDRAVFRIAYTGWLHDFMDPRPLFRGVRDLVRRHELTPAECRFELVGTGPTFVDVPFLAIAAAYGLEAHLDIVPRLSRRDALAIQARASVLVAFDCRHPLCVPMKVFDYARMHGSLLLIGHRSAAMAEVAGRLGTEVCPLDDPDAVDRVLEDAFRAWRSGEDRGVNDPDGHFARSNRAESLDRLLRERILAARADRGRYLL